MSRSRGVPFLLRPSLICPGPIVSQACCAPVILCPGPAVVRSTCVPVPVCPSPIIVSVPLFTNCVVSQSRMSRSYCVPVPSCSNPVVSQSCCVPLILCPSPTQNQSHCVSALGLGLGLHVELLHRLGHNGAGIYKDGDRPSVHLSNCVPAQREWDTTGRVYNGTETQSDWTHSDGSSFKEFTHERLVC